MMAKNIKIKFFILLIVTIFSIATITLLSCEDASKYDYSKIEFFWADEVDANSENIIKSAKARIPIKGSKDEYKEFVAEVEKTVTIEPTCEQEGEILYKATISDAKGNIYSDEIVEKIEALGHIEVEDEAADPTFENDGLTKGSHCSRCKKVIKEQQIIHKIDYSDYCYSVTFEVNEHIRILIYSTKDYQQEPVVSNIAYSRDGDTGEWDRTGEGQVNFAIELLDDAIINGVNIDGNYKNLKELNDIPNLYRITKITGDLVVSVDVTVLNSNTKMISNLASSTSEDGVISFEWEQTSFADHIEVVVECDGAQQVEVLPKDCCSFIYNMLSEKSYYFSFCPYTDTGIAGRQERLHRAYSPQAKAVEYNRIEINTENNIWPIYETVTAPFDCLGLGIQDNDYCKSSVVIYDKNNDVIYDTANYLKDDLDNYSGAKIKIRGNTSAQLTKKPYKIKLSKAIDLFKLFGIDSNYKEKEYLLLAQGSSINYFAGRELSNILGEEYNISYIYVSLFVNGDYQGLYILSEGINETSCDISETGYVIENDAYWWNEDCYFNTALDDVEEFKFAYTFKYPDTDDITSAQIEYIQEYMNTVDSLLIEGNINVVDYLDYKSYATWLLVHDILGTKDGAGTNMYVVKNDNTALSVIKAGPTWDFDSILQNNDKRGEMVYYKFSQFYWLVRIAGFNDEYISIFDANKGEIVNKINEKFDRFYVDELDTLVECENNCFDADKVGLRAEYDGAVGFISNQISWIQNNVIGA